MELASALIYTCEYDGLCDEGRKLAERRYRHAIERLLEVWTAKEEMQGLEDTTLATRLSQYKGKKMPLLA